MHFIQLILRALQLIFGAIVLALSVVLIRGQVIGSAPAITGYSAFVGAFGLIVALIGIAAAFVEAIPGLIMGAIDALAVLFYLAGSIALAVKLRVHSCSIDTKNLRDPSNEYFLNPVINSGSGRPGDLTARCREAQADTAFLFFALAAFIGSLVLDLMSGKGSMKMGSRSAV